VPGLKEHLYELFDDNMIDYVQYKRLVSTDRSTLETITKATDEFVESFCEQLKLLLTHSFVAKQQSSFQLEAKSNLQSDRVFQVIEDFSENNSFVLQDEAQGFHWNNSQATVHHFMVGIRHVTPAKLCCYVRVSSPQHSCCFCISKVSYRIFVEEIFSSENSLFV